MGQLIGKSTEEEVMASMRENRYFPFREVQAGLLELSTRNRNIYSSILLILGNTLCVLYLWFVTKEYTVVVLNGFGYIVLIYRLCNFYNDRVYILVPQSTIYKFYIGDKLAKESHYHNIYIRLKKQIASDERICVRITLDGYGIEPYYISRMSDNFALMRTLATKIAKRLDLNYFDVVDVSRLHKIRHRCPDKVSLDSSMRLTSGLFKQQNNSRFGHSDVITIPSRPNRSEVTRSTNLLNTITT